jgi:hypothetical protein
MGPDESGARIVPDCAAAPPLRASNGCAASVDKNEYTAKARYKGSDTFAIKATGKGPTASGTSVITMHATIQ